MSPAALTTRRCPVGAVPGGRDTSRRRRSPPQHERAFNQGGAMTRERALTARVTFAREQRFAAGVRIGTGSIVDDDVVLGAAGADADAPVIGERAVIRRGSEVNT